MTAAATYTLDAVDLIAGLLLLAACVFVAGWVARGEYDLYLRSSGKARRRRPRDLQRW